MTAKPYYAEGSLSVKFYDVLTRFDEHVKGDIEFFVRRLGEGRSNVLELGCGTGRVSTALAERGFHVVAIDVSEPMLRLARAKQAGLVRTAASRLTFLHGDLLEVRLRLPFDGVLLPYYTFNHLNASKRARALQVIRQHLSPAGIAIIHALPVQRFQRTGNARRQVRFERTGTLLDVHYGEPILDKGLRRMTLPVRYEQFDAFGQLVATSEENLTYFWFSDREFATMVSKAGLHVEETLSSFDGKTGVDRVYVLGRG